MMVLVIHMGKMYAESKQTYVWSFHMPLLLHGGWLLHSLMRPAHKIRKWRWCCADSQCNELSMRECKQTIQMTKGSEKQARHSTEHTKADKVHLIHRSQCLLMRCCKAMCQLEGADAFGACMHLQGDIRC